MKTDRELAQSLVNKALRALKKGDKGIARRMALKAANLAPQIEDPWLLLVYVASPRAAAYYLKRALQINPAGRRALEAHEWLENRSGQISNATITPAVGTAGTKKPDSYILTDRQKLHFLAWLILMGLMFGLAFVTLLYLPQNWRFAVANIDPGVLVSRSISDSSKPPSFTWIAPPTETQVPTSTMTVAAMAVSTGIATTVPPATASPQPTETVTLMPTATSIPTKTATLLPTETSTPTDTQAPSPTELENTPTANSKYVVQRGDTLNKIARLFEVSIQALISTNNIPNPSLIYAGQKLNIPGSGSEPVASLSTADSASTGTSGKYKEILIDISDQHMWAYEDQNQVFSFVVSTGIGDSTRIGTFSVLDKIPNAYSSRFNIWMPYWLGIYYSGTLENGIHGLPLLWNGVELWGDMLGQPATYGCIEAKTSEIKQLYDWTVIGTTVIIRR